MTKQWKITYSLIIFLLLLIPFSFYQTFIKSNCCQNHGQPDCTKKEIHLICTDGYQTACQYNQTPQCIGTSKLITNKNLIIKFILGSSVPASLAFALFAIKKSSPAGKTIEKK